MSLFQTVDEFIETNDNASRAIFEAAMIEKIQNGGYKMSDLLFEVYILQRAVNELAKKVDELGAKKKG